MTLSRVNNRWAASLALLIASARVLSCTSDPCFDAQLHLSECLRCMDDDCRPPMKQACDGKPRCAAECIARASCAEIQDHFSGDPTRISQAFDHCLDVCALLP